MNIKVEQFTQGKNEPRNEDYFDYNESSFVLSDGATDKSGQSFDGKTGGEILSRFLVKEVLTTDKNGVDLINYLTEKIQDLYRDINPDALNEPDKRFSATLVCVRVENGKLAITQVGDSVFRLNQKDIYRNDKIIDIINSQTRSSYIKLTNDIAGGREYILPLLRHQYKYQNNPDSPLGYGAIDGTIVPEKFVKIFTYELKNINTLELVSDGYFSIPERADIKLYEDEYSEVEDNDPDKYKQYLSTKSSDDRTVAIISFE